MSRSTAGDHLPRPFPAHAMHPGVQCKPGDDLILFPARPSKAAKLAAEMLCNGCPVQGDCLAWAVKHSPRTGYYGGMSPAERRKMVAA